MDQFFNGLAHDRNCAACVLQRVFIPSLLGVLAFALLTGAAEAASGRSYYWPPAYQAPGNYASTPEGACEIWIREDAKVHPQDSWRFLYVAPTNYFADGDPWYGRCVMEFTGPACPTGWCWSDSAASFQGWQCTDGQTWDQGGQACVCPISLNLILTKDEVKPLETTLAHLPNAWAVARDCHGTSLNNFPITFESSVEATSGSHYNHPGVRPSGMVGCLGSSSSGVTAQCSSGSEGIAKAVFYPSEFSGVHKIKVSCVGCELVTSNDIKVLIKDLALTGPGVYIGAPTNTTDEDAHPDRHYLRREADRVLKKVIREYVDIIGEPLCLNDATLPWGGKFDYVGSAPYSSWSASAHQAHSCGTSIDIAGKVANRPEYNCEVANTSVHGLSRETVFQSILQRLNVQQAVTHTNHYHLYLLPLTSTNGQPNPNGKRSALPCSD